MEIIKFDRIISVNSELPGHGAQNILNGEISPSKNWMCEKGTEKAVVILQLERAAILTSVHVGNSHSAFVEVLVGKAADGSDQYESLIPMSLFMNPQESKTGRNPNRTRFFKRADFNEATATKSWDRIKVVCSQPFNKHVTFGLCFLEVHGEKEAKRGGDPPKKEEEKATEGEDEIEIGSFFKKMKRSSHSGEKPTVSVNQEMKEAEKEILLAKHTSLSVKKREKFTKEKISNTDEEREKRSEENPMKRKKTEGESEKREENPVKKKKEGKTESEKRTKERKKEKKKRQKKPFEKLLEDVVLVISGFKNPLRGDIRSMALKMGAKYSGDWEHHCTHLVCAYENTPKFRQVKGKGKIVRKEWVEKCHEDRRRYPWRRFALGKTDLKEPESEEEIDAGEESEPEDGGSFSKTEVDQHSPKETKSGGDCYDVATDDEEEKTIDTTDYPMPYVPEILASKKFYVDPNLPGRAFVERYIVAYNGVLLETFDEDVDYYVTETGGALLELFRKKAPNAVAIKPSWIWEINAKEKIVPTSEHRVM